MSGPARDAGERQGVDLDLVIQAEDLAPGALEAFEREVPHRGRQEQPASVRLIGVTCADLTLTRIDRLRTQWRCDAALVPHGLRLAQFRVLALDMDSTLIRIESLDELAALAGKGPEVAAITEAAMRGEIADYSSSLRRRVALLAGADANLLHRVASERMELTPGAERLIAVARQAGLKTLLVTGGFGFFTRILQRQLGLDAVQANELQIDDGRLSGAVFGPDGDADHLVDAQAKAQALLRLCAQIGCDAREAIAVGDGANDLPMLRLAGMGVAFHAKPKVRASTGYALDYSGLDGLLEWMN